MPRERHVSDKSPETHRSDAPAEDLGRAITDLGDDAIVDGITGTLRASRDRRNRLAAERAARLVADGAVRDDNSDDSCSLNHDRYNAETAPSCLVTASARSWQSGGRGSAAVAAAVSWWNGYRRAGGHRLFTANDPEPTGIARLLLGVRDSQSGCRTMRTAITGTVKI